MTLDETRDALAEMDGWDAYDASNGIRVWRRGSFFPEKGERYYEQSMDHPHPPTLDGADAAFPEGWDWERVRVGRYVVWFAWYTARDGGHVFREEEVRDTGDKIADLYALALECRRAMNPLYTPPTNGGTNPTT